MFHLEMRRISSSFNELILAEKRSKIASERLCQINGTKKIYCLLTIRVTMLVYVFDVEAFLSSFTVFQIAAIFCSQWPNLLRGRTLQNPFAFVATQTFVLYFASTSSDKSIVVSGSNSKIQRIFLNVNSDLKGCLYFGVKCVKCKQTDAAADAISLRQ